MARDPQPYERLQYRIIETREPDKLPFFEAERRHRGALAYNQKIVGYFFEEKFANRVALVLNGGRRKDGDIVSI